MEEFLKEKHAEQYTGLDDDMSDAFDNWMMDLDVQEWIELSESYAIQKKQLLVNDIERLLKRKITELYE